MGETHSQWGGEQGELWGVQLLVLARHPTGPQSAPSRLPGTHPQLSNPLCSVHKEAVECRCNWLPLVIRGATHDGAPPPAPSWGGEGRGGWG